MKMNMFAMLFAAAALAGCYSVRLPPDASRIIVESFSSPQVATMRPKLAVEGHMLTLRGAVYRKYGARTTTETHIDVYFLDAQGQSIRSEMLTFSPNNLAYRPKGIPPQGNYRLPIDGLPPGTARIEVRAHDQPHTASRRGGSPQPD